MRTFFKVGRRVLVERARAEKLQNQTPVKERMSL